MVFHTMIFVFEGHSTCHSFLYISL
ncbi:hypothetical protein F383_03372 [Gossypium arboreum]|uniref:Uncharacterized protein n=1 Tax=Gossypium arboreum TaxID=29729 RepID=A0A0B0PF40_GOSAR|nr:hypothetical protein F383_03372 [Gossypium arboreum]